MLLPLLSDTLRSVLNDISSKEEDPIVKEILYADRLVEFFVNYQYLQPDDVKDILLEKINSIITDEVSMISVRMNSEFEVSFLPKGREPEYPSPGVWGRSNRQTGKPARIFQKLLKREFKTREWEIFSNKFRAEICASCEFQIVEGEAIREWYLEDNYYKCDGTLGNSCMRYSEAQPYFNVYVDNAKMLITKKSGLLTGRALIWQIGDITVMDRIYTCFDYLENCFISYAKEHRWWIRESNSLLSSGCSQYWLSPNDDYRHVCDDTFTLQLKDRYEYMPYMDSFRYYDISENKLYTYPKAGCTYLDSTDGSFEESQAWECARCGYVSYSSEDEQPDDIHWSEHDDRYYCDDCCWWCDELDDYISNDDSPTAVIVDNNRIVIYPHSYIQDSLTSEYYSGQSPSSYFTVIDGDFYRLDCNLISWNKKKQIYEIRSDSD